MLRMQVERAPARLEIGLPAWDKESHEQGERSNAQLCLHYRLEVVSCSCPEMSPGRRPGPVRTDYARERLTRGVSLKTWGQSTVPCSWPAQTLEAAYKHPLPSIPRSRMPGKIHWDVPSLLHLLSLDPAYSGSSHAARSRTLRSSVRQGDVQGPCC